MGTRKSNQHTEEIKCSTCNSTYSPACDWRQGRCPHHPSSLDIYHHRYYNLIKAIKNFFKF
jgi:hypothetical protein